MNLDRILAAKRGDQIAFAALTEEYAPLMNSLTETYAFSLEGLGMDAEDLRQEASLAFYRALVTYDTEQTAVSFGLYAKICIRNRMISLLRHLRTEQKRKKAMPPELSPSKEPFGLPLGRDSLLRLADRVLSKREKTVFFLYIKGKSYLAIAQAIGVTTKSVDNALYRAKQKLRAGYAEEASLSL